MLLAALHRQVARYDATSRQIRYRAEAGLAPPTDVRDSSGPHRQQETRRRRPSAPIVASVLYERYGEAHRQTYAIGSTGFSLDAA